MSLNEIRLFTDRLTLRGIRLTDAEALFRYRSNPQVYEFQGWKPQTLEEVEAFLREKTARTPNVPDTWFQLAVVLRETDVLIGDVGIHFLEQDNPQAEIGYTLNPAYQSKGYATEAIRGVLRFLFEGLGKHRVTASVDPRNTKSIALLERIGMRREAHFRKSVWFNGEWADDIVYALLQEEWQSQP